MKERPIIMSAESVQAILDGRKTQTRRIIKGNKLLSKSDGAKRRIFMLPNDLAEINSLLQIKQESELKQISPYGQMGDRLWVKENFIRLTTVDKDLNFKTFDVIGSSSNCEYKKMSSLFMTRSLSRLTLEITKIRVERLQDITEDDAIAEGCYITDNDLISCCNYDCSKHKYEILWNKLNAKRGYSWDSNPFVWVIEFRRVEE
jgi:hypothetical protein